MEIIKYPSINGLRALSIILVLFHHLEINHHIFENLSSNKWITLLTSLLKGGGQMGVNVFFVISGFLITYLLLQEEEHKGNISLKNFYIRRTLRIFPAYYFLLFTYFILQCLGYISISGISWITAITYTKYFNWDLDWYTAHAWSLSVEEQFYLFWPLIFTLGDKGRKYSVIALFLIVPLIRMYPTRWTNDLTLFVRIDAIALGCFFALYKKEIIKILTPYWNIVFYFSIAAFFLLKYVPQLGTTYGSVANLLIGFIMMYSIFGPKGIWFKFLNLKPLNYIGILSYSIYLWQQIFINNSPLWINQFPQNILLIIGVSVFSYYLIEKPFLRLKSKFSKKTSETHLKSSGVQLS